MERLPDLLTGPVPQIVAATGTDDASAGRGEAACLGGTVPYTLLTQTGDSARGPVRAITRRDAEEGDDAERAQPPEVTRG